MRPVAHAPNPNRGRSVSAFQGLMKPLTIVVQYQSDSKQIARSKRSATWRETVVFPEPGGPELMRSWPLMILTALRGALFNQESRNVSWLLESAESAQWLKSSLRCPDAGYCSLLDLVIGSPEPIPYGQTVVFSRSHPAMRAVFLEP
jgi:hypothetical protein